VDTEYASGMPQGAHRPTLRALVADVGGTKLDFAICEAERSSEVSSGDITLVRTTRVASAEQSSFEAAVSAFLGDERVDVAVLAVAGPVVDGQSQLTNLPWLIDRRTLERAIGAPVDLINDFAALGYAVPLLTERDLLSLARAPRRLQAPFAVIGAGTGLGVATFVRAPGGLQVLAGEGGHADFAARSELEVGLWRYLNARHGRVSVERVLSGQGLASVYAFLREQAEPAGPRPADCVAAMPTSPNEPALSPAEVSERALDPIANDPIAREALALWLSIYGAEAGNLALRVVPEAGLYIAGGIAQKLGARLAAGELMSAFRDKDPMRAVLERIPVDVIMRPDASLIGAFARALVL
jgi:glucokinase